jgi:hypothetical protein
VQASQHQGGRDDCHGAGNVKSELHKALFHPV